MVKRRTATEYVFDSINLFIMVAVFVIMVYPFLYVINYSISDNSHAAGSLLLLPKGITFDSYRILLSDSGILHAFLVSVSRSLIGPVLQLFVTGMAAYVLTISDLVAGKFFRVFFILPMYVTAGIIPNYIFYKAYGITNSFLVYILPNICSSFNLILIRTYIESIPKSLSEAAYLDGGNDFQTYWRVIFPVCMPVNAAVLLFGIITQWNSLMDTEMYCAMTENLHTLQYVLFNTLASKTSVESLRAGLTTVSGQGLKMAITVITVVPVLFVYPFLRKYFVSGIMIGSVKA